MPQATAKLQGGPAATGSFNHNDGTVETGEVEVIAARASNVA